MDMETSHADTLKAFDDLVRTRVLPAMQSSLGTSPLPLHLVIAALCLTTVPQLLDRDSALVRQYGILDAKVWPNLLDHVASQMARIPLGVNFMSWLTSKCLHLHGWREWAFIALCYLTAVFFAATDYYAVSRILLAKATTSNEFMWQGLFLLYETASFAALGAVSLWQHQQAKAQSISEGGHRQSDRQAIRLSISDNNVTITGSGVRSEIPEVAEHPDNDDMQVAQETGQSPRGDDGDLCAPAASRPARFSVPTFISC